MEYIAGKNRIGKFYSWEIIDTKTAIKTCDKSVFIHRGSGIPHEIIWFFGAENMAPGKKNINLKYCEKTYSSALICSKRKYTNTVQILWHIDLGNELLKMKKDRTKDYSGFLRFTHHKNNEYEVEFIGNINEKSAVIPDMPNFTLSANSPLEILSNLITEMNRQEASYLKAYTDALNIEDIETMLKEQQRATLCVRSIKKWNAQLNLIRNEIEATGLFSSVSEEKTDNNIRSKQNNSKSSEIKIGKYIQERMGLLEKSNIIFSDEELYHMMNKDWSKNVLHLGMPFIIIYDSTKILRDQIVDEKGNNRYWNKIYSLNGNSVFICSQWYYSNKKYFDTWISSLAEREGITFPERSVVIDTPENKRHVKIEKHHSLIQKRKIGNYVQKCLRQLETMKIRFQNDYFNLMFTKQWTHENFKIGNPFLKIFDSLIPVHEQISDKKNKNCYWSTPFKFGNINVFVCNEWHENSQELFEKWLKDVPLHTITTQDYISKDNLSDDVVKLTITDFKIKKH